MTEPPSYLDELDQLLFDQGEDWMSLTELDGYLTGIVVSPDLVTPGSWLEHIWAGEDGEGAPVFDKPDHFQHFLDLVRRHYNDILFSLEEPGSYAPIFDIDTRSDEILWEIWIDGFVRAMELAPDGWRRLAMSDNVDCKAVLKGIATLDAISNDEARLSRSEIEQWTQAAPNFIPIWVEMLHAWRLDNDPNRPTPARHGKVGRNDPCPCGSGKKYKKCCGLN